MEALLRFQNSLILFESDALRQSVADLAAEIQAERELLEEIQRLRNEGNALVNGRHYTEAVERFVRSMSLRPDEYLAGYVEALREMAEREVVFVAEATRLREEGDVLMRGKKTSEALVKYKESLRVWHDESLAIRVREEEARIAQAKAAELRKEAEALTRGRNANPAQALAKYRESLTYAHDDVAAAYVKSADEAQAQLWIEEGDRFVEQKQPEQALEKYRSAAGYFPDDATLLEKIHRLELILTPAVGQGGISGDAPPEELYNETAPASNGSIDLVQADALYKEGNALYREKKYREALGKYRESYRFSGNRKILEFADQLEKTLESIDKANELVKSGNESYRAEKYKEALEYYKESLKFHPNPEIEAFILRVEALLN
jgi:tetratricopeptide (TPR) repeat protein